MPDEDPEKARREIELRGHSAKGQSFEGNMRRRGRPAHLRSPDDSPLRDGNRDRLMGLLTFQAARTLLHYLSETNPNVHYWLQLYMHKHPIPTKGSWDDVSGETFLRQLLAAPIDLAKWSITQDPLFDCVKGIHVDPKDIARRILSIRAQLAKEFIQDLQQVEEENIALMRDSLTLQFRVIDEEEVPVRAGGKKVDDGPSKA